MTRMSRFAICRRSIGALALLLIDSYGALAQPAPASIGISVVVGSGLSGPVGIAAAGDNSARLFVIQQGGAIRVVRNGLLNATPYLSLSNAATLCREHPASAPANTGFVSGGEQGLLGLAFHPNFENNGQFFVSFSGANGDSIIARYAVGNPSADVVSGVDQVSCLVILRVDQDFSNHNGGNILFGRDGFLYFGLGDGGSGGDPCNRAQTLDPAALQNGGQCGSDAAFTDPNGDTTADRRDSTRALLGKILRLNIDSTTPAGSDGLCGSEIDGSADYAIPPSNPFAQAGQAGCDEVYTYGMRNPWRFSFDRLTGDLIIGDVGQDRWEEVSFFAANGARLEPGIGANFDWNLCEGRHLTGSCTNLCAGDAAAEVIIEYNNAGNGCTTSATPTGCSVTGGFRYRGPDPLLQGVYFYGDACTDELYFATENAGAWTPPGSNTTVVNAFAGGTVLAFGEDDSGALYVIGGSRLYRIGSAPDVDLIFADGFERI